LSGGDVERDATQDIFIAITEVDALETEGAAHGTEGDRVRALGHVVGSVENFGEAAHTDLGHAKERAHSAELLDWLVGHVESGDDEQEVGQAEADIGADPDREGHAAGGDDFEQGREGFVVASDARVDAEGIVTQGAEAGDLAGL
jgi:hypothetical protein